MRVRFAALSVAALLFIESLPFALIVYLCFGRARARPALALVLTAALAVSLPGVAYADGQLFEFDFQR
ncbi:MAG: hypothetical protein EOP84_25175 [Verrucomicrobiaceae bacterium]|nr:MAG: hypothetical protein EOP84_25175 [Verrucomicrobiaceae bacterium]